MQSLQYVSGIWRAHFRNRIGRHKQSEEQRLLGPSASLCPQGGWMGWSLPAAQGCLGVWSLESCLDSKELHFFYFWKEIVGCFVPQWHPEMLCSNGQSLWDFHPGWFPLTCWLSQINLLIKSSRVQQTWSSNPPLPYTTHGILGGWLTLSKPQFPQLENGGEGDKTPLQEDVLRGNEAASEPGTWEMWQLSHWPSAQWGDLRGVAGGDRAQVLVCGAAWAWVRGRHV